MKARFAAFSLIWIAAKRGCGRHGNGPESRDLRHADGAHGFNRDLYGSESRAGRHEVTVEMQFQKATYTNLTLLLR